MVGPWIHFLQPTVEVVGVVDRFITLVGQTGTSDIHVPFDPDTQTLLQTQSFVSTGNVTGITTVSAKYLTAATTGDGLLFPPATIGTFVQASSTQLLDCFFSTVNLFSIENGTVKVEVYATPNSDSIAGGTLLFTSDDITPSGGGPTADAFLTDLITLPVDQFLTFVITPTDLVLTYTVNIFNGVTISRDP